MEEGAVNPRDIVEQLTAYHAPLRWSPLAPSQRLVELNDQPTAAEESLAYLHANWQLPVVEDDKPGRGPKGFFSRRVVALTARILERRLRSEQDLISHLVRQTEALSRRCDELTRLLAVREVDEAANQARLAGWLDASALAAHPGDEE
jgi:hypothetical protein